MTTHTSPSGATALGDHASLRHVLVVGGSSEEWAAMSPDDWKARIQQLGGLCAELDVPWLTVRVYDVDGEPSAELPRRRYEVDSCTVTVDPSGNGRQRFAEAMRRVAPDVALNEKAVAAALYAPAEDEPDLVVVLGPSTQLPPSLVWELAYAELVFTAVAWADFSARELAAAINDFSHRHRRFGGLDPD